MQFLHASIFLVISHQDTTAFTVVAHILANTATMQSRYQLHSAKIGHESMGTKWRGTYESYTGYAADRTLGIDSVQISRMIS